MPCCRGARNTRLHDSVSSSARRSQSHARRDRVAAVRRGPGRHDRKEARTERRAHSTSPRQHHRSVLRGIAATGALARTATNIKRERTSPSRRCAPVVGSRDPAPRAGGRVRAHGGARGALAPLRVEHVGVEALYHSLRVAPRATCTSTSAASGSRSSSTRLSRVVAWFSRAALHASKASTPPRTSWATPRSEARWSRTACSCTNRRPRFFALAERDGALDHVGRARRWSALARKVPAIDATPWSRSRARTRLAHSKKRSSSRGRSPSRVLLLEGTSPHHESRSRKTSTRLSPSAPIPPRVKGTLRTSRFTRR